MLPEIRYDYFHRLGQTTVQLSKEITSTSDGDSPSALVLCDSRLYRVTLYPNDAVVDHALTALHLTNQSAVSIFCSVLIPVLTTSSLVAHSQKSMLSIALRNYDLLLESLVVSLCVPREKS